MLRQRTEQSWHGTCILFFKGGAAQCVAPHAGGTGGYFMPVNHSIAGSCRALTRIFSVAVCIGIIGVDSASEAGDDVTLLPKPSLEGSVSLEHALAHRRSIRRFDPSPVSLAAISQLLWAAQGTTDERGFRTAPSAGALFPLEVYLVVGAVSGLTPGIYHYDPDPHRLMRISTVEIREQLARAAYEQNWIADAPAVLVLVANYDRTTRKYGSRGARYVQMEAGHAAQNVYLQSEALELGTCMVGAFREGALKELLGLSTDLEPLGLMPVGKRRTAQ